MKKKPTECVEAKIETGSKTNLFGFNCAYEQNVPNKTQLYETKSIATLFEFPHANRTDLPLAIKSMVIRTEEEICDCF